MFIPTMLISKSDNRFGYLATQIDWLPSDRELWQSTLYSSPIILLSSLRPSGSTWLSSLPSLAKSIVEAIAVQRPGVSFKGLLPTSGHLVFYTGRWVHFLSSPHPPLPFYEQVKDMEPVQLLPVISCCLLPSHPHAEKG